MIETHAHLDFPQYDEDRSSVIERALASGIEAVINVASSLRGSLASLELAKAYDCVYASCGVHPHDTKDASDGTIRGLKDAIQSSPKVVAIGEVGIDLYRNISAEDIQVEAFSKFVSLSRELRLPLILHCREEVYGKKDAAELVFDVMEDKLSKPFKGVMHCFSGTEEVLKRCLDSGLYVSYTCNITYKNAQALREAVKKTPLDRLLIETDSPFLSPQARRGERNEPANLKYLVTQLAEIYGVDEDEIRQKTTANAKRLFWGQFQRGHA